MVPVVQLVRASDCGSECPRFESVRAPQEEDIAERQCLLFVSSPSKKKEEDIAERQCLFFCEQSVQKERRRHRRKAMSFFCEQHHAGTK